MPTRALGVSNLGSPLGRIGATYFIDATGGNDANSGRLNTAPWQTMGKVNGTTFLPGDRVLFKRGETWTGTALTVPSSGKSGAPITFGVYGPGATKPIIDGNDTVNCVVATSKNFLRFEDIEATQGLDSGFQFNTCHHVVAVDCEAHDAGNDNLIFITACYACVVYGGKYYAAYERTPTTQVSGIEIADDCYDIVIDSAECYSQVDGGHGITVHSHALTGMPTGITIRNSNCHDNTGHGIQILKQDDADDTGDVMTVHDNNLESNTLDGIRVHKTGGAADYVSGIIAYSNESITNSQYAYYFSCKNSLIRHNVWRGRGFLTACQSINFQYNTMYFTTGIGLYPLYINDAATNVVNVRDNITEATVAGGMMIGVDVAVVNPVTIDYNLYYLSAEGVGNTRWHWKGVAKDWADWLADSNQDANSPVADQDPLFVSPPGDLNLQAGSPARGVGIDLGYGTDLGAFPFTA